MKKYLIDTNIILRFLLKDNERYYQQAAEYFRKAKNGIVELYLIPEVLFEIDYVLRGVYGLSKKETVDILLKIVKTPYLKINNQTMMIDVVERYQSLNIDLFDIYLSFLAKEENATVLSFDRDFEKIKQP